VGSCEDDVEISGSIKDDEFLERLSAFQRGCTLQLVKKISKNFDEFQNACRPKCK
jgi:hypothetical protein